MSKIILLAEDSSDDEILFRRVLNSLGVMNPVHVVRDGQEAISFLKSEGAYEAFPRPAALFLDLKMPGIDGWEVLRWLKAQNSHPDLLVIVLTAYGERQKLQEAYQLGADSFLFKPINSAEVMDVMRHWPDVWMLVSSNFQNSTTAGIAIEGQKSPQTPANRKASDTGGLMDGTNSLML